MFDFIARWWSRDRIRVSHGTGEWLALQPGRRVIIGDNLFYVVARCVLDFDAQQSCPAVGVRYHLHDVLEDSLVDYHGEFAGPPMVYDGSPIPACERMRLWVSEGETILDCFL